MRDPNQRLCSILTLLSLICFQEIEDGIRQKEEEEKAQKSQAIRSGSSGSNSTAANGQNVVRNPDQAQNQGFLTSTLTNLFVIVGFAAFAYTVKYVLRSIVE